MFDEDTRRTIRGKASYLPHNLREDFKLEAMRELYDFMPFDRAEINSIIERVFRKYHE
jgi:hypothetical protein